MADKVISLEEAAAVVQSGDTLALGGVTLYRRPVAFVRALLQREAPPDDLTLLCFTAGYESDLLIGAGLVSKIRTCYCGLEAFGLSPMFTEKVGGGEVQMVEESEGSLAHGMRAHLAGVSFMPGRGWIGTDLLKLRPDVKVINDPYRPGEKVVAFPAINWDVAVIHAVCADRRGNARLNLNLGVDPELTIGAREVIITAEEVVDKLEKEVDVVGTLVTGVVHAPRGAWPTSCYPLYALNGGEILRYIEACNSGEFKGYLQNLRGLSIDE